MRRLNTDAIERAAAKPHAGRKNPPRRRPAPRWRAVAWRIGRFALLLSLTVAGSIWLWRTGMPSAVYGWAGQRLVAFSAASGYRLRQVVIEGRRNTPKSQVLAQLGVRIGDPLLALDPASLKSKLESLGWVRTATVERRLPDELFVRLGEAIPSAIWQQNGVFHLIDRDGRVISDAEVARFARLVVIVGPGAPQHLGDLLDILGREPQLAARVRAAVWVGDRRWNLRFDNGVDVKLPADSPRAAWSLLARLEREQSLLARDIGVIDMRLPDRLVVRLGPAAELQRQPGNDT
jgi:cell division protein FtsQ